MNFSIRIALLLLLFSANTFRTFLFLSKSFDFSQVQILSSASASSSSSLLSTVPSGYESYEDRPKINEVEAQEQKINKIWDRLKRAQLAMVIQLHILYPAHHFYFLARDAELLFDTATLLCPDMPSLCQKIHLLNVSRTNKKDSNLKNYLAQNGISDETLKNGRKLVFVDTGFEGSIPAAIVELFDSKYHAQMQTQLMVSAKKEIPSSRAFLRWLTPLVNDFQAIKLYRSISGYELIARFSDRSTQFSLVHSKWSALSPKNSQSDGFVSKEVSLRLQQDLKFFMQSQAAKLQMTRDLRIWNILKSLFESSRSISEKIRQLKIFISNDQNGMRTSFLIDYIEAKQPQIMLKDLGIKLAEGSPDNQFLATRYPEYRYIFEDPKNQLTKLIENNEFETLTLFLDKISNLNLDLEHTFFSLLGEIALTEQGSEFIKNQLENGGPHVLANLAMYTFSRSNDSNLKILILEAIKRGDNLTLFYLSKFTFPNLELSTLRTILPLFIEHSSQKGLRNLALHIFSHSRSRELYDQINLVIGKANDQTLKFLKEKIFVLPIHSKRHDLIEALNIESTPERIDYLQSLSNWNESKITGRHSAKSCSEIFKNSTAF